MTNAQRYYTHRYLKKYGCKVKSYQKKIFVPAEPNGKVYKHLRKLLNLKYIIQYTI